MKQLLLTALFTIFLGLLATSSFAWSISENAIGCGSISPSGNHFVSDGANMTFTVTPDEGCHLRYLIANNNVVPPFVFTGEYTFTNVQANHKIEAVFDRDDALYPHVMYNVISSSNFGGIVTPEGENTYTYENLSFHTFDAYSGYRLLDVKVDGISVGPVPYYYFVDTGLDHTIEAIFTPDTSYPDPALLESSSGNYSGIQGAYDTALAQDTIKVKAGAQLNDGLNIQLDRDVDVKLQGGYDEFFSAVIADTEYYGSLTIWGGSVNVSNLIIK